jgi:hypothetical protein
MFHTHVASVLSECCVCLQWFSSVFQVFLQVFQIHVLNISYTFRYMLQWLYLDILKVDRGVAHGIRAGLSFRDAINKA